MTMTAPILVTGGTDTLGRLVVPRLRDAGCPVRVLSRHRHEPANGFECVVGDLATGEGLDAAVDGIETIVQDPTTSHAEIAHPDYPGERLIACRDPALAELRARKRDDLLAATEALLDKVVARVQAGAQSGQDNIGVAVGKVIDRYKVAKHLVRQPPFGILVGAGRCRAATA
jgi:NAD(P)-dependent dehydrogenase (short-subunit alcohol dehydrogenase family)